MAPVVWSVKCTFEGKILGSDPNLTFCVLIILLTNFVKKMYTDLTIHCILKLAYFHCNEVFIFCYATKEEVKNEILNLLFKKATRRGNILLKY